MSRSSRTALIIVILTVAVAGAAAARLVTGIPGWTAEELAKLRSLALARLQPLAPDPSNRYGDDPRAVALGHRLFFDTRLSSNGRVACASCHLPGLDFQDGTPLGVAIGRTNRRTMPIAGTAHLSWFFWDGRSDSHWGQALGPLENPVEHGGDRTQYAHLVAEHYADEYEAIFGALPETSGLPRNAGPVPDPARRAAWDALPAVRRDQVTRVYANIGKAIAAYERRLEFGPSRFDRYVDAVGAGIEPAPEAAFTADEIAGLRLFIGKAGCTTCHTGPLFTDDSFHNTGVPPVPGLPDDRGRAQGARDVLASEFNCLGPYSDAKRDECGRLGGLTPEGPALVRAFKTPSLRNVAARAPYMHAGQFGELEEVVRHYNTAPPAPAGTSEVRPLGLSEAELGQLVAFLRTLSGPIVAPPELLRPPPPPARR